MILCENNIEVENGKEKTFITKTQIFIFLLHSESSGRFFIFSCRYSVSVGQVFGEIWHTWRWLFVPHCLLSHGLDVPKMNLSHSHNPYRHNSDMYLNLPRFSFLSLLLTTPPWGEVLLLFYFHLFIYLLYLYIFFIHLSILAHHPLNTKRIYFLDFNLFDFVVFFFFF